MKKFLLLLIVLLGFFSCKKDEKRSEAGKIVTEWVGKEIKFPSGYECNVLGKDTTLCVDLLNKEHKASTSCGCTAVEWKKQPIADGN